MAKKVRVLLSLMTEENDYQLEQAAAARRVADSAGVDLQTLFAKNDTITQSTQLLRAIQSEPAMRPEGVLLEPVGGTALPQVARAACKAGIAWGVLNNVPDYLADLRNTARVPVFAVGTDHAEIGRIEARQCAALLPRGGNVLYIQGPSEHVAAKQRSAAIQPVLPANIRLTSLRGNWTEEGAAKSVTSWLKLTASSKIQIDLVAAQNDVMAMAARRVFEGINDLNEREHWLSLPFIGCDGLPSTGQAWVREGLIAATVIMAPSAGEALRLMTLHFDRPSQLPETNWLAPESFPALEKLRPAESKS
jgi:ribose transport system substrate-binding protein